MSAEKNKSVPVRLERIALLCPEVPGHLNPICTLGAELQRRGHDVILIGGRPVSKFAERFGISFAAIGVEDDLDYALAEEYEAMGERTGFSNIVQTIRSGDRQAEIHLRHLPRVLEQQGISCLIIDQFAAGAWLSTRQLGLPTVIACCAMALIWPPAFPTCPPGGKPRRSPARATLARCLDWLAYRYMTLRKFNHLQLFHPQNGELARISQQPAWFDFPRPTPPHFHYTGPWHSPARNDATDFEWSLLDDRPLVYASMGTLQNGLSFVLDAIVESASGLDIQIVLSTGGRDVELSSDVPSNVHLVRYAPQLKLLDRARLAITHGGLNTVLECIARGVPMLCLPVGNDQPEVARRVKWLGLGDSLSANRVTVERLRARITRLLKDEHSLETAKRLAERMRGVDGVAMSADIVELAFSKKQPVRTKRVP